MLWILVPIAVVIIAIVIAFPLWFTHRRMRHDHDLASAEQYLEQIGKSHEDAAHGRPATSRQDTGVPAASSAPRGRHAAPEPSEDSPASPGDRG